MYHAFLRSFHAHRQAALTHWHVAREISLLSHAFLKVTLPFFQNYPRIPVCDSGISVSDFENPAFDFEFPAFKNENLVSKNENPVSHTCISVIYTDILTCCACISVSENEISVSIAGTGAISRCVYPVFFGLLAVTVVIE
ncbi:MAG: hypothetical protein LBB62_02830 [Proteiniphilum sp.]|jgi:hypothetical protein|nr:hypothetical protein [Proteiniphilum sp.]